MKYGMLEVLEEVGHNSDGRLLWRLRCDCGGECVRIARYVRKGITKSCGCRRNSHRITHGHSRGGKPSSTYVRWQAMRARCDDKNNKKYVDYGGRGISYPESWKSFEQFHADMGDCPEGMTLERRGVNANYSKANCYWATMTAQARNKRTTRWLEFAGERLSASEWASRIGIRPLTLIARLNRGWSIERALTEPLRQRPPT